MLILNDFLVNSQIFEFGLIDCKKGLIMNNLLIEQRKKRAMSSFWWGTLFWVSALMMYVGYVGKNETFIVVWLLILLWSWKKHSDVQAEYGPTEHLFTLGNIEIFNNVIEKYTTSDQKISVKCLEPYRKVFDFKTYPSKYIDYKILVGDNEYSFHDISKFIIDEDENIKRFYATQASIKRATGKGGQSISDAMARQRDLRETRRVIIEFKDGTSYFLSDIDMSIAKEIEKLLSERV